MSTPGPPDRSTKRHKSDGPMPPGGYPYGQPPPHGRYQQPPYGPGGTSMGPQSAMGPQSSYMYMQHGQYSNAPPSQRPPWPPHNQPPPPGPPMYGQRGGPGMTQDHAGYGPGYGRGPPPPMQGARRGAKLPGPPHVPPQKTPECSSSGPQSGFQGGWGHPQGGQYQYSGGPPPANWQGSGSRMQQPPPAGYGNPAMFNATTTPPRGAVPGRPRPPSQEMIRTGYLAVRPPSGGPGIVCQPIENSDMETMYHSLGVGPDDDGNSSTGGTRDSKDKGRGSYKCGRCGVPKKGHICPYQPKLSRRPGEPMPEMRSAALQVEMDEFMTLRRLNLKIQGFPESYATEPFMDDDMVVGEPAPPRGVTTGILAGPPHGGLLHAPDTSRQQMTLIHPQDPVSLLGSPIRSSPVSEDPIMA